MTDLFANLLRKQLRFLVLMTLCAIIGVIGFTGWSWTSGIVTVIACTILLFAWSIFSFWIWFFRNAGRQGTR